MIEFINKAVDVLDREKASLEKAKWTEQAKQWRLPYWDFARFALDSDELRLPVLAIIPEVMVKDFRSGKLIAKPNPLYKFETQELMGKLEEKYAIKDQGGIPVGSSSLYSSWQKLTLIQVR